MAFRATRSTRSTLLTGVGFVAVMLWTGCSSKVLCNGSVPPKASASFGPDVDLRVLCGTGVEAPVATVSEVGSGVTLSLQGDPAFTIHSALFLACARISPTVALVRFTSPVTAVPGEAFDTVVTVHANDGSFADGTVRVHALIVVPQVTVDKTAIDFGDVPLGGQKTIPLTFTTTNGFNAGLNLRPDTSFKSPFTLLSPSAVSGLVRVGTTETWLVAVQATALGDYTSSFTWTAPGGEYELGSVQAACLWTTTTALHARVLDVDAGASVDAPNEGGTDGD